MNIIYQDQDIVVAVKPARVLSTDEPGGMPELVRQALGTEDVRTVHRLDRVVSGLMVPLKSTRYTPGTEMITLGEALVWLMALPILTVLVVKGRVAPAATVCGTVFTVESTCRAQVGRGGTGMGGWGNSGCHGRQQMGAQQQ